MKRFLIKAGVLIGVFIAGVILFSNILNRKETANTKGMEYPTLPVMYMVEEANARSSKIYDRKECKRSRRSCFSG